MTQEKENIMFENNSFKITKLETQSVDYTKMMSSIENIKDKMEGSANSNLIKSYNNQEIYKTEVLESNIEVITQKISEYESSLAGFSQ